MTRSRTDGLKAISSPKAQAGPRWTGRRRGIFPALILHVDSSEHHPSQAPCLSCKTHQLWQSLMFNLIPSRRLRPHVCQPRFAQFDFTKTAENRGLTTRTLRHTWDNCAARHRPISFATEGFRVISARDLQVRATVATRADVASLVAAQSSRRQECYISFAS